MVAARRLDRCRQLLASLVVLVGVWLLGLAPAEAALTATMAATPRFVPPATPTTVTYTLTIGNTSTWTNEVVAEATLPVNTTFATMVDFTLNGSVTTPGPAPVVSGRTLTWGNGGVGHALNPGQTLTVRFTAVISGRRRGLPPAVLPHHRAYGSVHGGS